MQFQRRVTQMLHEDHRATTEILKSLDDLIAKAGRNPPDVSDPKPRQILTTVVTAIQNEIGAHFAFEEDALFTRLEEAGDIEICTHLREEHKIILPLGHQVASLAQLALTNGFSTKNWQAFQKSAGEMIGNLQSHILKEDMALLPIVDELLDDPADMEISTAYSNHS